jgi:hypothetical protein
VLPAWALPRGFSHVSTELVVSDFEQFLRRTETSASLPCRHEAKSTIPWLDRSVELSGDSGLTLRISLCIVLSMWGLCEYVFALVLRHQYAHCVLRAVPCSILLEGGPPDPLFAKSCVQTIVSRCVGRQGNEEGHHPLLKNVKSLSIHFCVHFSPSRFLTGSLTVLASFRCDQLCAELHVAFPARAPHPP